ncbi:macrolide 2'-phosphotransferase [Oceanobacillus chungangensis]|uniref:Macrolide 2'-phosphotransferase n=1 Tax=Oceanobacillus chungangensis TaxID=1229152 RepID=A0A3D8PKR8_9BACI|nr:macrolide 2'-phosphotransferase [Oceanobacillus chungangensis]RDW16262.1 macrolide 2'-phosphotransferase [Oceanobacillus chungangensis]
MTLNKASIIEIAKRHGIDVVEGSLRFNESGLDFQVVFATDPEGVNWVLRFPRRVDVIPTAKKEKLILDIVEPILKIEAPNWIVFSDELIAYKLLSGIPAGTIDPAAKAYIWEIDEKNVPKNYYETLGRAMAELHAIDHSEAKQAGLTVLTPQEIRKTMVDRMGNVRARFGVSDKLWERWQKWTGNDSIWPKRTAFIHGDLHPGHILIDEEQHVTGFIDWTEARVDDVAHDFVSHLMAFGEDSLKKLITSYEKSGGYVWSSMFDHIVELQAAYPIGIAEFAIKSGLPDMEEMAKEALGVK